MGDGCHAADHPNDYCGTEEYESALHPALVVGKPPPHRRTPSQCGAHRGGDGQRAEPRGSNGAGGRVIGHPEAAGSQDKQNASIIARITEENTATVADIIQIWLNEGKK